MKQEELRKLLELYYSGSSTSEDEIILREYFSGNDIFPGYEAETEIFAHYSVEEIISGPSGNFEQRIIKSIDDLESTRSPRRRTMYITIISVAATLLILTGSYFFFTRAGEPKDTFSDPAIAYAETMKILNEVSAKMEIGTRRLEPISKLNECALTSIETVDRSASMITGSLKRIEVFNKLSESTLPKNN
jgi:hypothetical protein